MAGKKGSIAIKPLEPLIFTIRGRRVMLDADLARVDGVTTKRFNEAFKRNRSRFPEDFSFQITAVEFANLRSQFAASRSQAIDPLGKMGTGRILRPVRAAIAAPFIARGPLPSMVHSWPETFCATNA